MSDRFESDVMEDLFEDEAEGMSQFEGFEEEGFEEDAAEEDEVVSGIVSGLGARAGSESFEEFEEWGPDHADGFDAYAAVEDFVSDRLGDDMDEFLGGLKGLKNIGRKIGGIARGVSRVARFIPLPITQAIAGIADVAGKALGDGADEYEAIDQMLDFAEEEDSLDAAAPVVAGVAIHRHMPQAKHLPSKERRELVRSVTHATRTLAKQHGAQGAKAIPHIVKGAQRAVRQNRIGQQAVPHTVRKAAAHLANNPQALRRFTNAAAKHAGGGRAPGGFSGRAGTGGVGGAGRAGGMGSAGGMHGVGHAGGTYGAGACAHCGARRVYYLSGPVRLTIRAGH